MKTMYKVVTVDELGYCSIQQDEFETSAEAQQEADECIKLWGEFTARGVNIGQDFWVESYEQEPYKEPRVYNNNAVDGWEDLYPLDDTEHDVFSHASQCYYDRWDDAQERLERGEICAEQAAEIRMGA